jgi:anti-anti-sigma factor
VIIEEKARGSVAVLSISGEYDTLEVPKFTAAVVALVAKGSVRIALSLEKLAFINSTGLGSFIREHERLAQAGGELACAALSKFTERNFRLLGMDQRIRCFATLDEAVAHLQARPADAGGRRVAFRFPDEGAAGRERRAEVLELREDGIVFRIDDLEGIDLGAVFRAGRALELRFGPEGAAGLRIQGAVASADSGAGRRLSVRAGFAGLSASDRAAVVRLAREIRGEAVDAAERDA